MISIPQKMEGDVRLGPLSFIRKNFMSYYEKGMRVHPLEFLNTVGGINMGEEKIMDLSDWTDEDLKNYEKAIKKEISKRSDRYKCCIEDGIYDLDLWKKLENGGLDTSYIGTLRSAFTKALYKICDLTLGNYRLYKAYNDNKKLECSGSKLYDTIYDNYVLMVKEIMDVVRKYDKKVNLIDEQK